MKAMYLKPSTYNKTRHVDLLIERDIGNQVLILMGKPEYALPSWIKLRDLCHND